MEQILRNRHDYLCKEVLSYKFVLATIMKYTLKEFEEYSIDEIINVLGNDDNEKIIGIQNAFPSHAYDVFFTTKFPNSNNEVDMLIDMEPQNATKLSYQLHNRGIFYIGNEISYQYGRMFSGSEYDKLKPVVSIFIGMDAPTKKQENSFAYFHLTKENKIGYNEVSQEEYDKINLIIIYLGKKVSDHPLFRFLNFIFKNDMSLKDRVIKMKEEYGIQVNEKFKEEVSEMCNISDYFKQQGIEQGKFEAILTAAKNIMVDFNVDEIKALKSAGADERDLPIYLSALKGLVKE